MSIADREKARNDEAVRTMIPKQNRKTENLTVVVSAGLKEQIRKITYVKRKSISGTVEELLTKYIEDNREALEIYDKLLDQ